LIKPYEPKSAKVSVSEGRTARVELKILKPEDARQQ
jgi:hypothetical protein